MTELFGMPIKGGKIHGRNVVEQKPLDDLKQVFLDLLADPNVVEFGWTQYTPHFNDGDICEFSVGQSWVRTVSDGEDADHFDLEVGDFHPSLGTQRCVAGKLTEEERQAYRTENHTSYAPVDKWERIPQECKYPETAELASKLTDIQLGCYENAMLEAFGDHAEVTVTREGFQIDEYYHD